VTWTVQRRYEGDTRSAWFASPGPSRRRASGGWRSLRTYMVSPVHGCFLVVAHDARGRAVRADYRDRPAEGRALAEQWHSEWLKKHTKRLSQPTK
jgi:hypothetical protein